MVRQAHGRHVPRCTRMPILPPVKRYGRQADVDVMFPGLDAEAHRQIAAVIRYPITVARGEHLVRSGDPFHHLYVVHDGLFKDYVGDASGREHVWGFSVPGEFMGLHAITPGRYQASFVALEASCVASLSYPKLLRLFDEIPALYEFLMRAASQVIGRMQRLGGNYTAEVRLAAFLMSFPGHYQRLAIAPDTYRLPMTRRDIANYLRLVPETVSRLFSHFTREGLIRVDGANVTLLQPARLEQISESLGEV